jgi:nucleotide-binding universal stress UspA family protein
MDKTMDIPKIEIKKILYTTDLSESGRYAFSYAASLANAYKAEITVLHVIEEGPELDKTLVGYISEELWEQIKKQNLEEAREILVNRKKDNAAIRKCVGDFCEEIQSSTPGEAYVTYEIAIEMGNPVEKILEYAAQGSYDLIVVGSHGHGTLDTMIGDTARRIVRRSEIPVFVVRLPR